MFMQVSVFGHKCNKLRRICSLTLRTQLLRVRAILEVKYLVRGAKNLLQFSYEIYDKENF